MHLVEASDQSVPVMITQSLGLAGLAWAAFRLKRAPLDKSKLALAAGLTLLVLAGQAVNITVAANHSGHFMGATLLAMLLGPAAALLSMACVLTIQAVALGDGSIATLGTNFLAIGIAPIAITAGLMALLKGQNKMVIAAVASFSSVVLGAFTLAGIMGAHHLELVSNHLIIGALEAGMTLGLFALFSLAKNPQISLKPITAATALFTCALPFSSELPDGLEVITEEQDAS